MPELVALGECMVEFYSDMPLAQARTFTKTLGGDTLNTLAMAARLGSSVGYVTKVGADPFGDFLLDAFRELGVETCHVAQVDGFTGIYFIALLPGGQRRFIYYRRGSAASTLGPEEIDASYLTQARMVFSSGITQGISPTCRGATLRAFQVARGRGALVAFDANLRPALWPSLEMARAAFQEVLPYVDILSITSPEETGILVGASTSEEAIRRLWQQGVTTVAVKEGEHGCLVGAQGQMARFSAVAPQGVVDTTGAGDAFNGAFLHALLQGHGAEEAARWGVVASGLKVGGRGAVDSQPDWRQVEKALAELKLTPQRL